MGNTPMRVRLEYLGCRLNEAELESWARHFQARGIEPAGPGQRADLLVVNSCAVTEEAVRKSRKLLRRLQRENPGARLVMSGCWATLAPEQAEALGVDLVVSNPDKARLVEIAARELDLPEMPAGAVDEPLWSPLARNRQRAFVKVQDGCRHRCSYCVVTLARGAERSVPVAEVVAEVNRLHAAGLKEVVLAGVHLGGFGSDLGGSLAELVQAVLSDTDLPRLRLGSIEPWTLDDAFLSVLDHPRLMPHLHLPVQSGADTVLRRMSRRGRRVEFLALVERLRDVRPELNLTTDLIVGFPGETEAEWRQTLDLAETVGFGDIHIFAFSPRPGTRAATLPDPVPRDIQRRRGDTLQALADELRRAARARLMGRQVEVLVEGSPEERQGKLIWSGYSPDYQRIHFPGPPDLVNRIVPVNVTGETSGRLQAHLCNRHPSVLANQQLACR